MLTIREGDLRTVVYTTETGSDAGRLALIQN
jgi:hypothetical protein